MIGGMTSPLPNVVGLAQAAKITGRSVSTIRRKKAELELLGATTDKDGWKIPVEALVQVWNLDRLPEGIDVTPPVKTGVSEPTEVDELRRMLEESNTRFEREHARANIAEQIARERQEHISSLQMSLRMLERGRSETSHDSPQENRRRWWQRR